MKNIKKVLIFVLFVFASVFALNLSVKAASTVTFDLSAKGYANAEAVSAVQEGDITVTFNKASASTAPAYYTSGTAVRVYGGGNLTVSANGAQITQVKFTFGSSDKTNTISVNDGTFATNTWTGSASEVVFTVEGSSGHRRFKVIEVTYETTSAEKLAAPIATLNGKTVSWNAVANATGYNVGLFESEDAVAPVETAYSTTSTQYTIDYKPQGTWYVKVKALGDGTNNADSVWSASAGSIVNNTYETKTVTEFLALATDTTNNKVQYEVTGTITGFYNSSYQKVTENTYDAGYGNVSFYISDGTSEVLCYRVTGEQGASLGVGYTVTMRGVVSAYKSVNQIGSASYVSIQAPKDPLVQFAAEKTMSSMIVKYTTTESDPVEGTYTYEFAEKTITAAGKVALGDLNWNVETATTYFGYDSNEETARGQQIGSSGLPAQTLVLTSDKLTKVKAIRINTSGASSIAATLTVTVGGTQVGEVIELTKTATDYTFTASDASGLNGEVVLSYTQTSSKAIYIKSIEIDCASTTTTYNLTSASLRFGTVISKDLYDELAAKGATWGVEIKAGDANATQIACTPVRVNANGVEDANGEYYQFALVINKIGYANIDTVLTAKVYVEVNSTKTYMNEASHSLRTLVDTYLAANDKSAYEDHLGVLNHLSSYGK